MIKPPVLIGALACVVVVVVGACSGSPTPSFGKACQSSAECAEGSRCRVGPVDDIQRCLPPRTPAEPGDSCAHPLIARASTTPGVLVDQRVEFAGARDDETVVCGDPGAVDLVVRFTVPDETTPQPGIRIAVDNPRVALSLRQSAVDGCVEVARFGCAAAGQEIVLQSIAPGDYEVVLDGAATGAGEVPTRLVVERLACPPDALPFDEGRCVRVAPVQSMGSPREQHALVRLDDGTIVIVGGVDERGESLSNFEALDAATQRWRYGSLRYARVSSGVTALPNGDVIVVGGAGVYDLEIIDFARTNGELKVTELIEVAGLEPDGADVKWLAINVGGRIIVINDSEQTMGILDTRSAPRPCTSTLNCDTGEACVETQVNNIATNTICVCVDPNGCDATDKVLRPFSPGRVAIERGVVALAGSTLVMALDALEAPAGVVDEIAVLDTRLLEPGLQTFAAQVQRTSPTVFGLDDQHALILGGTGADRAPIDIVEVLDVPRGRVDVLPWRLPRALAAPVVRELAGQLLVVANDGSDEAWLISPQTGEARPAPPVLARTGALSTTDGDSVVIVGGRTAAGVTRLVERVEVVAADVGALGDPVQCLSQPMRTGTIRGNTRTSTDAYRPRRCNAGSTNHGHDNLFTFSIDEPSSLRVFDFERSDDPSADSDHSLYLLRGSCDDAVEVACGESKNGIALFAGELEPGDYMLVVEYHGPLATRSGTFEGFEWHAQVVLDGPEACPRDARDADDDVLGGATFAALTSEADSTQLQGTLCSDDVDHVLFEHWGGGTTITMSGIPDGQAIVQRVFVDVEASAIAGRPVARATTGAPSGLDLSAADPGTYVVRLEASEEIFDFGTWSMSIDQGCIADADDSLTPELDNGTFARGIPLRPGERRRMRSCVRSDRDLFLLDAVVGREASIVIDGFLDELDIELFEVTPTGLGAARAFTAVVDPDFLGRTLIDLGPWTGPLGLRIALDPPADTDLSAEPDYAVALDQAQVGDSCSDPFPLVEEGERSGTHTGDATTFNNDHDASLLGDCTGYRSPGTEVVYAVELQAGEKLTLTSSVTGDATDASLYILDACVEDETACVAGIDEGAFDAAETLEFTNSGPAAEFYVVVDSFQGSPFLWELQWSIEAAP